jgi:hypothetical protein
MVAAVVISSTAFLAVDPTCRRLERLDVILFKVDVVVDNQDGSQHVLRSLKWGDAVLSPQIHCSGTTSSIDYSSKPIAQVAATRWFLSVMPLTRIVFRLVHVASLAYFKLSFINLN